MTLPTPRPTFSPANCGAISAPSHGARSTPAKTSAKSRRRLCGRAKSEEALLARDLFGDGLRGGRRAAGWSAALLAHSETADRRRHRGMRMRRLPHRSPRRRRRLAETRAGDRSGSRSRRPRGGSGSGNRGARAGHAGRRGMAGLRLRRLPVLSARRGELVPLRRVSWLDTRRRLFGSNDRGRPISLRPARRSRRRAFRALAMRGADRLSGAANG